MKPRPIHGDLYFGAMALALATFGTAVALFLRGPGHTRPDTRLPYVLLLRPFRSERRDFFSHQWVAPALWQFGQPIFPVDRISTIWRRKRGYVVPDEPRWKRGMFGYDRVLDQQAWFLEIPELLDNSALVVVDTSEVTENIFVEFAAIEAHGAVGRTICIFDEGVAPIIREKRSLYGASSPSIRKVVDESISYNLASASNLELFWQQIVQRAAFILGLQISDVPHPTVPRRFMLNPHTLVSVLAGLTPDEMRYNLRGGSEPQ